MADVVVDRSSTGQNHPIPAGGKPEAILGLDHVDEVVQVRHQRLRYGGVLVHDAQPIAAVLDRDARSDVERLGKAEVSLVADVARSDAACPMGNTVYRWRRRAVVDYDHPVDLIPKFDQPIDRPLIGLPGDDEAANSVAGGILGRGVQGVNIAAARDAALLLVLNAGSTRLPGPAMLGR